MSHSAEIIAVGTELLLGNITNTNARDISRALSAVGVNVFWHTVVGDNPERLRAALDIARNRADIIITTGGLGPTYDDLTKQTVCAAFGKPLVLRVNGRAAAVPGFEAEADFAPGRHEMPVRAVFLKETEENEHDE